MGDSEIKSEPVKATRNKAQKKQRGKKAKLKKADSPVLETLGFADREMSQWVEEGDGSSASTGETAVTKEVAIPQWEDVTDSSPENGVREAASNATSPQTLTAQNTDTKDALAEAVIEPSPNSSFEAEAISDLAAELCDEMGEEINEKNNAELGSHIDAGEMATVDAIVASTKVYASASDEVNDGDGEDSDAKVDVAATELEKFDAAQVTEQEFVTNEQVISIIESLLFASSKPQSFAMIKQIFKGTQISNLEVKAALDELAAQYASLDRGVTLEEVASGYQLRTKVDNMAFLRKSVKARVFRLSGPALEVLSITAYKQPCIKMHVDEIRGVESGHLLRGLMDRGFIQFAGKSELPGKPMLYATTKKFLETFGLRNIRELPSLSEIEELMPEDIGDELEESSLDQITDSMSSSEAASYSQGEEELLKITDQLSSITTSTDFFEQEKQRKKNERDAHKAQDLREREITGETLSAPDQRWLAKYDEVIDLKAQEEKAEAELSANIEAQIESGDGSEDIVSAATSAEAVLLSSENTSDCSQAQPASAADLTKDDSELVANSEVVDATDSTETETVNADDDQLTDEDLTPWTDE